MTGDTTSIDDLPMGGGGGGGGPPQNMIVQRGGPSENPLIYSPNVEGMMNSGGGGGGSGQGMMPPTDASKLLSEAISGVQRAGASGLTMLPTRDIPMNPAAFTHDDQVRPNYIPPASSGSRDYINHHETMRTIMNESNRDANKRDTLETIYQQFQVPILLAILYFVFQMPAFRAQILHFIPSLFGEDGNLNLTGLVATSVAFASVYFVIMLILNRLSGNGN